MADNRSDELRLTGYSPGVVGKITELHAVYYHQNWGFDASFETQVGRELSEFVRDFKEERDGLWIAWRSSVFAGAVAIDGHRADAEGARLRWFIVDPESQGSGIGGALLRTAIAFCNGKGYRPIYLWTFQGLNAARSLYRRHGFVLTEENAVDQWGQRIIEQKYELVRET
ncbi:MAG: GNAT family N-acetyltransferase [Deltaproteobacteria bacterium]|nr:GNAT family N-acetyltransferase [Deltaproteobacteria bacterium]